VHLQLQSVLATATRYQIRALQALQVPLVLLVLHLVPLHVCWRVPGQAEVVQLLQMTVSSHVTKAAAQAAATAVAAAAGPVTAHRQAWVKAVAKQATKPTSMLQNLVVCLRTQQQQ
jgi:hypothetical protein